VVGHDWLSSGPLVGRDEPGGQHKRHHHNDFGKHPRGPAAEPLQIADCTRSARSDQHGEQQPSDCRMVELVVDRDLETQRVNATQQPENLRGPPQRGGRVRLTQLQHLRQKRLRAFMLRVGQHLTRVATLYNDSPSMNTS